MSARMKDSYAIHAVEHALDLLEALGEEGDGDGVQISQLSSRLGMNKSSIFRLLATLELRGYVQRVDGTKKYRLGLHAYEIAQRFLSRMGLLRKARPVMERLARCCDEAVYLVVRRGEEVLFLDMFDSGQQVKLAPFVGRRYPLATFSAGKILLAFTSLRDERQRCLLSRPGVGSAMAEELMRIRVAGYAVDTDGLGEGVTCVAAPLLNDREEIEGGLAILSPAFRHTTSQQKSDLCDQVLDAATAISAALGFYGRFSRDACVAPTLR